MFKQDPKLLFLISDIYLPYCNSENGDYSQMLIDGSISEQPYMTMKTLDLIKLNYKIFISEERKKQTEQAKVKAKRSRR